MTLTAMDLGRLIWALDKVATSPGHLSALSAEIEAELTARGYRYEAGPNGGFYIWPITTPDPAMAAAIERDQRDADGTRAALGLNSGGYSASS